MHSALEFLATMPDPTTVGVAVLVVDVDGFVTWVRGDAAGIATLGERFDPAVTVPDRTVATAVVDGVGSIVWVVPERLCAAGGSLIAGLGAAAAQVARLEGDMESMNSSSLALLEHVAMVDDLVTRLPSCATDHEVVRLGLESLLVAASVRHAAYIAWDPRSGRCARTLAFDTGPDGTVHERSEDVRPFDPAISLLDSILAGGRDLVQECVEGGVRLGVAGLPEREAEREFLAVPVRFGDADEERTLGAIVIADKQANRFSNGERLGSQEAKLAATLARMIGSAIGSRMVAAVGKELGLAREIQQQILPDRPARVAGFELAGRCETSGAVGGDYYDFVPMADDRTMALVADVSGHNLASGMVMVAARTALRLLASRLTDVGAVVSGVGDAMLGDLTRTERFISLAGVAIRPTCGEVEVVNAGHADVLVRRAPYSVIERVASSDTVLGFAPGIRYDVSPLELGAGDVMLLYTDGVVEAQDAHGRMFGDERLEAVLAAAGDVSAAEILDAVFRAVSDFAEVGHGGDDVTVLVVRRVGGESGGTR